MRSDACWPIVPPSWPMTRRPDQSNSIQPRPQCAAPAAGLRRQRHLRLLHRAHGVRGQRSACHRRRAAVEVQAREVEEVARRRAGGSNRRALRARHVPAWRARDLQRWARKWPVAARNSSASSGSVTVARRPAGSSSRVRSASSHVAPVSCSMIRPSTTKPALQYDHISPGAKSDGRPLARLDVARDAVVAAAKVVEEVAVDAARVREKVAYRDGGCVVAEAQLRQDTRAPARRGRCGPRPRAA